MNPTTCGLQQLPKQHSQHVQARKLKHGMEVVPHRTACDCVASTVNHKARKWAACAVNVNVLDFVCISSHKELQHDIARSERLGVWMTLEVGLLQ